MLKDTFNKLFFPHDRNHAHLKALDGLRGLAVLIVLLSHSANAGLFFHEYLNFSQIGKIGVYLFFVLSAYLLDRQIALAFFNHTATLPYWKNYFLRRFLRIYPLYLIALFIYGLFTLLGIETKINRLIDLPLHMLLLKGKDVFWSIPVEFKYYFLSPVLMWFCNKYLHWERSKILLFFVLLIAVSIAAQQLFHFPLISTFRFLPVFLVGTFISVYEIWNSKPLNQWIRPLYADVLAMLSLIIIVCSFPYYFNLLFHRNINSQSSVFYLPYALLWGFVLLAAKYGGGFIRNILTFKPLRYIGSISFSMYLFHMLFLNLSLRAVVPQHFKIYLFFALTIFFSSLSYLSIERPLSKIRLHATNH
jgi:peptidoglycan/LPS O-acetylase OafA/YrhL